MTRSSALQTHALTLAALTAFASNSLLCRLALRSSPGIPASIDPAVFTSIRLASGALALWLIVRLRQGPLQGQQQAWHRHGNWASALALFVYAAPFSFAYLHLTAGTGALILFGFVQATMIGWGLFRGARPGFREWTGLGCAVAGLIYLLAPGVSAPEPWAAALMAVAGIAWGVYSLRGRGSQDPLGSTAANFIRSLVFVLPLLAVFLSQAEFSWPGAAYAVSSGALASGLGYAVWYAALRGLTPLRAAVVQLLVPVLAALAGIVFLDEVFSLRLLLAGAAVIMGIAMVVTRPSSKPPRR